MRASKKWRKAYLQITNKKLEQAILVEHGAPLKDSPEEFYLQNFIGPRSDYRLKRRAEDLKLDIRWC